MSLYTQAELDAIRAKLKRRIAVAVVPAVVILAAAVGVFVWGRMQRSDTLWMLTAALTVLGGGYFLFLFGVYVRPAWVYRTHVNYMLHGRMRTTTGVLKSISPNLSDHDGLECHALMLNIGDRDDPEDDRLFYYDALKPALTYPLGMRVTVLSNDKLISSIEPA